MVLPDTASRCAIQEAEKGARRPSVACALAGSEGQAQRTFGLGEQNLQKGVKGFLSVCALVISATVLSVPISGMMGAVGSAMAQEEVEKLILKIGFLQDIDSLNPYVGLNDASYVFYGLVYDAMTVIDNDMNPWPDLALSVNAVPETDPKMIASGEPYGSVWQYNLTHSAMWTDGEPFDAYDVEFNIELNAENYTSMWAYQPYSYFMEWVEVIDKYTVRIHFYDPVTQESIPASYAYLISIPMLPKHRLEDLNAQNISFKWKGYFEDTDMPIVGTGPFMSSPTIGADWYDGNPIKLLRNPNYHWYADKVYPDDYPIVEWRGLPLDLHFDELHLIFFEEATAMDLALRKQEIDVAAFTPGGIRKIQVDVKNGDLEGVDTYTGRKVTQYWTEIDFCMNKAGNNPSRIDKVIRHALAMATNKDYIVSQYYLGYAEPATTIIPPVNTQWHYEPSASEKAQLAYDLEAAAQLLEDNGYRYPATGGSVRVATSDSPAFKMGLVPQNTQLSYEMLIRREYPEEKNIAAYLKDQWAEIGVVLNYEVVDEAELSARVYTYSYDTCIWYWSADIDPNYQLFVKTEGSWFGWSDNKWKNVSYEENYSKSITTIDPVMRETYVDNCQRVAYLDTDYILIAYVNQTYAWNSGTWGGWGDWEADPGRSVDNFWTGNPLYFDLYWIEPEPWEPPWVLIALAAGIFVAIIATVVYLKMRGKKKEGSLADESPLGD